MRQTSPRHRVKSEARPPSGSSALPPFVAPCLAQLAEKPPSGEQWIHEIKLDGYRLQAQVADGTVRLLTRRGEDWTHRFTSIARAMAGLPCSSAALEHFQADRNQGGFPTGANSDSCLVVSHGEDGGDELGSRASLFG